MVVCSGGGTVFAIELYELGISREALCVGVDTGDGGRHWAGGQGDCSGSEGLEGKGLIKVVVLSRALSVAKYDGRVV